MKLAWTTSNSWKALNYKFCVFNFKDLLGYQCIIKELILKAAVKFTEAAKFKVLEIFPLCSSTIYGSAIFNHILTSCF